MAEPFLLTRKVLLLNASYEPLGTVGVARAVRLVWRGVVEVVEPDGERVLRSPRFVFPVPSVIRLMQFVDARGKHGGPAGMRGRILARDRFRCQYCGARQTAFELTLDHILPRSRGGRSTPENLCAACVPCNQRKGNRTPEEARMPLLADPAAFTYGLTRATLLHLVESRPEWGKYFGLPERAEGVA